MAGRRARGWRRSLPGAAAAAAAGGSWRPWLRRPQAAALGNAGGSVPPGPAALAAAAPAPSLGPRVTWPGLRASLQGPRNPLPALPAPLQRAPRARLLTPHTPAPEPRLASGAHPSRKSRSSASDRRHSGCMPAARSLGETFWCLLYRHAAGRGELPKMRDVSEEIHKCTPWQTDVSPLLPVNLWFCFLPRSGKCVPGVRTVACFNG